MKNIHILPTEQPSKLHLWTDENGMRLALCELEYSHTRNTQNLYITSNEEIKEGDWFIHYSHNTTSLHQAKSVVPESIITTNDEGCWMINSKKIILTDNSKIIADGVQSIDDEFLEWFVKNPICEFVEVQDWVNYYKIFIPQEEPKQEKDPCNLCGKTLREQMKGCYEITCYRQFITKQETLEEAAEEYAKGKSSSSVFQDAHKRDFIAGAKWIDERMYSEEEKELMIKIFHSYWFENNPEHEDNLTEWELSKKLFEQFKKK